MSSMLDNSKQLEQCYAALKEHFSPSRKQEGTGNPSQLVLLAEHALKVSLWASLAIYIASYCPFEPLHNCLQQ